MRVLVCGGRDWIGKAYQWAILSFRIFEDFNPAYDDGVTIIEGGAKGADQFAADWALLMSQFANVSLETYPANWNKYGKQAGFIRNKQMIDEGKPDLVIAFPGGKGTDMMCKLAEGAGIPVEKYDGKFN